MNSSHLMCHFDDGISLIPCSFFFYWPCFQIGVTSSFDFVRHEKKQLFVMNMDIKDLNFGSFQ